MTNHTEFVIKKASSSDQYTLFKIASQFDKISKIANDDGTMQLRNKNEEDILSMYLILLILNFLILFFQFIIY